MRIGTAIILCVFAAILLVCINKCNSLSKCEIEKPETSSVIVSVQPKFDSAEVSIIRDTIQIKDSFFVATNTPVDTAEVIRRFLTAYFYRDTFRNSDLSIVVSDSLFNNRLTYRAYQYKILRPDSIITKETAIKLPVKLPVWYAGVGIGVTGNTTAIMPKIAYSNPKGYLVETGLIFQNFSPGIYAGLSFKIK